MGIHGHTLGYRAKQPGGLDLAGLLDTIEAQLKDAPDRLQWTMNHTLAQIGIEHTEHRARAIEIGERLEAQISVVRERSAGQRRQPARRPPA